MVRRALETPLFDPATNDTVRAAVPEPVRPIVEAATHLGDPAAVLVVAVGYLWFANGDDDRRARVLAVALVAFAVTNGLKGLVTLERPVEQLAFAADDYGGYSFPSGHALGAAAVYSAVAVAADRGRPRNRYAAAGTLISVVALSRVVLGVHYPGDVVAGVAIGLALGAGLVRLSAVDAGRLFVLAGVVAVASYASPARAFMPATVGAALGAIGAWYGLENRSARGDGGLMLSSAAIVAILGGRVLSATWGLHQGIELAVYALAVGAALAAHSVDTDPS
jgi:membrane-associated phospholipid phosphatase